MRRNAQADAQLSDGSKPTAAPTCWVVQITAKPEISAGPPHSVTVASLDDDDVMG